MGDIVVLIVDRLIAPATLQSVLEEEKSKHIGEESSSNTTALFLGGKNGMEEPDVPDEDQPLKMGCYYLSCVTAYTCAWFTSHFFSSTKQKQNSFHMESSAVEDDHTKTHFKEDHATIFTKSFSSLMTTPLFFCTLVTWKSFSLFSSRSQGIKYSGYEIKRRLILQDSLGNYTRQLSAACLRRHCQNSRRCERWHPFHLKEGFRLDTPGGSRKEAIKRSCVQVLKGALELIADCIEVELEIICCQIPFNSPMA